VVAEGATLRPQATPANASLERIRSLARKRRDEPGDEVADIERVMAG